MTAGSPSEKNPQMKKTGPSDSGYSRIAIRKAHQSQAVGGFFGSSLMPSRLAISTGVQPAHHFAKTHEARKKTAPEVKPISDRSLLYGDGGS
jgi:hypothetical protein